MEKQETRVLEIIGAGGPAHCHDVADEMGISMRTASAVLSALFADGFLVRHRRVVPAGRARECWEYELPTTE